MQIFLENLWFPTFWEKEDWSHKPTHTDRYLHSRSFHHPKIKSSVKRSLVAYNVCNGEALGQEFHHISKALQHNGYKASRKDEFEKSSIIKHASTEGHHYQHRLLVPPSHQKAVEIFKHDTVPQDNSYNISDIWRPLVTSKSNGSPIPQDSHS